MRVIKEDDKDEDAFDSERCCDQKRNKSIANKKQ